MSFGLKKKLCTLTIVSVLAAAPLFAGEVELTPETLQGFVEQSKMTNLSEEYITGVGQILNKQIDEGNFADAEKTANYFIDISKKFYGRHHAETAYAYVTRARLYRNFIMPEKAIPDLKKAESIIKWNIKNKPIMNILLLLF